MFLRDNFNRDQKIFRVAIDRNLAVTCIPLRLWGNRFSERSYIEFKDRAIYTYIYSTNKNMDIGIDLNIKIKCKRKNNYVNK